MASKRFTSPEAQHYDLVVVGAGIVGLSVACELSRRYPGASVCVLEREARVAAHQSSHNSGVIHAGIYYEPGSLKARLCVQGARELYDYCRRRSVAHRRSGKLIVARDQGELSGLHELERRGRANGVADLRLLDEDEIREIEPHARGAAALYSPHTGVCDFAAVADALHTDFLAAGGSVRLNTPVVAIRSRPARVLLDHPRGTVGASHAIFCCGAWSDRLAEVAGADAEPRIVPFRGAYLRVKPHRSSLVRALIYPVPRPDLPFLGVHLTKTIDGTVLVGPTALLVAARDAYQLTRVLPRDLASTLLWPGTWRMARRYRKSAVYELGQALSRRRFCSVARCYVPKLRARDLAPGPAGVRGQALARDGRLVDDFVVSATERALHVRNAPSPAATSCFALARLVCDRAAAQLDLGRS